MDPTRWIALALTRVRSLIRPGVVNREIEEELDFHLEMERRKLAAAGLRSAHWTRPCR